MPRPRIQQLREDTTNNGSLHSSRTVISETSSRTVISETSKEGLRIVGEHFSPASPSSRAGASVTASPRHDMRYRSSYDSAEIEPIICSETMGHGAQSSDVFTAIDHQSNTRARPQRDNKRQYDLSEPSPSPTTPRMTKSELVSGGDGGRTPLPARSTAGISWRRMTVAMPKDHEGAFHGDCL